MTTDPENIEALGELAAEAHALEGVTGPDVQVSMGNAFGSLVAVGLFIGVNRFVGLPWAIAAVTIWTLYNSVSRWRNGLPIGKFMPIVTAAIVARGVIGIITDSEAVYFGIGIATKAGIGLVLIGSVLIRKNLFARYAPVLFGFDDATQAHPVYRRSMDVVAVVIGLAELVSAAFDVWLFARASANQYVLIRFLVNWPFSTVVIAGCLGYLSRSMRKIPDFPGLESLLDRQLELYKSSIKKARG